MRVGIEGGFVSFVSGWEGGEEDGDMRGVCLEVYGV